MGRAVLRPRPIPWPRLPASTLPLPLGAIEFPQAHHLANDLRVEAVRFRFRVDFPDVGRQRGLFFFEPFDALDERFQPSPRNAGNVSHVLFP